MGQATVEALSPQNRIYQALHNRKFLLFFKFCGSFPPSYIWIQPTKINADPCGYGSTSHYKKVTILPISAIGSGSRRVIINADPETDYDLKTVTGRSVLPRMTGSLPARPKRVTMFNDRSMGPLSGLEQTKWLIKVHIKFNNVNPDFLRITTVCAHQKLKLKNILLRFVFLHCYEKESCLQLNLPGSAMRSEILLNRKLNHCRIICLSNICCRYRRYRYRYFSTEVVHSN